MPFSLFRLLRLLWLLGLRGGSVAGRPFWGDAGRGRAVGGGGVLEEGVGDAVDIVDVAARTEVAVDNGIATGRILKGIEHEESQHCGDMLENTVLNGLVGEPSGGSREAVHLERDAG